MKRRTIIGTVATLLVAASLAVVSLVPPALAAQPKTVGMMDFKFIPAKVVVHVGDTVRWTYNESSLDPMPNCESVYFQLPLPVNCPGHSTTSKRIPVGAMGWDSGVHRRSGFPYSVTFSVPGTYHYICTVHGGSHANNPVTHMEGDVVVQP